MIDRPRSRRARTTAALGIVAAVAAAVLTLAPRDRSAEAADPDGVVVRDDFERETPNGWDFTDKAAWRIVRDEGRGGRVLEQFQASKYEPPVRSPFNVALRQGAELGGFVLDVKAKSTTRDYGHRDMCLIFGYVDPSHFYYVHLANAADEHANSIFKVDGKPRVSIAENRTTGTKWDDGWHDVRIKRDPESGLIEVYFDDMTTPAMSAHDKSFPKGRIGLGTFDDTGMYDDLVVKAPEAP